MGLSGLEIIHLEEYSEACSGSSDLGLLGAALTPSPTVAWEYLKECPLGRLEGAQPVRGNRL